MLSEFSDSSGTIGTGEPAHFMEYRGFCISGVFTVNAFESKQRVPVIIDGHLSRVSERQRSILLQKVVI